MTSPYLQQLVLNVSFQIIMDVLLLETAVDVDETAVEVHEIAVEVHETAVEVHEIAVEDHETDVEVHETAVDATETCGGTKSIATELAFVNLLTSPPG